MKYEVTGKLMNWTDALIYADSLGKYIPNYKQAKEIGLDIEFWTSTTDSDSPYSALTNKSKNRYSFGIVVGNSSTFKSELLQVVLIDKPIKTNANISYALNDEADVNARL
jgi:hypothetical protein